jgi:hypothetical protein
MITIISTNHPLYPELNLKPYRRFIDEEMLNILGQMDSPSKILDFLYLGSEWNASNLEELTNNKVQVDDRQCHIAWGYQGSSKELLGPTIPYHTMPCGWPTARA